MSAPKNLDRQIESFLADGPMELPDASYAVVRDRIERKRQQADFGLWRTSAMNLYLKYGLAAAAVVVIAVVAINLLPGSPLPGGGPSATPGPSTTESATPVTLASGSFTARLGTWGRTFDIEATGTGGDDVSGTMEVSSPEGTWSVDLQCSRTADNGLLVIAGEVRESTNSNFSAGAYSAIVLAPGTPVRTMLFFDVIASDEVPSPADSCPAFLETMFRAPEFLGLTVDGLAPIEGDLQLGP